MKTKATDTPRKTSAKISSKKRENFRAIHVTEQKSNTSNNSAGKKITLKDQNKKFTAVSFLNAFEESPAEHIRKIKQGLPVDHIDKLSNLMGEEFSYISRILNIPGANISRWRQAEHQTMNQEASERVLGMVKLIGQVQSMVSDFGNPKGFDAGTWFRAWSEEPNPALNGSAPVEFLDTVTGQQYISNLLMAMAHGVYH